MTGNTRIPKWHEVLTSMDMYEKIQFTEWWKALPPFNHQFDMQAIVAMAFKAGRDSVPQMVNSDEE